eukprot:295604-Rhodomonas_salina.1
MACQSRILHSESTGRKAGCSRARHAGDLQRERGEMVGWMKGGREERGEGMDGWLEGGREGRRRQFVACEKVYYGPVYVRTRARVRVREWE